MVISKTQIREEGQDVLSLSYMYTLLTLLQLFLLFLLSQSVLLDLRTLTLLTNNNNYYTERE